MGNSDSKLIFRKAIVQLTTKNQIIDAKDNTFWDQFWSDHFTSPQDVFALIPASEIRLLRDENPENLATLCYKVVERLAKAVDSSCRTQQEHQTVLNCVRLLTRILPYVFEDANWKDFFWSSLPPPPSPKSLSSDTDGGYRGLDEENSKRNDIVTSSTASATPLAHSLINAVCDLLFCPDFTVVGSRRSGPDKAEELANIDSCEYIWEAGVGFANSPPKCAQLEQRRIELLKLLLTCFSETMYRTPNMTEEPNKWIAHFTSAENRHALPLFTSLLNTVCAYDPVGLGIPYNYLLFVDTQEPLVEVCLQILIVTLDHDMTIHLQQQQQQQQHHPQQQQQQQLMNNSPPSSNSYDEGFGDNLFINYLSRIHRDEDFNFILKGITRLLNNPLVQSYLPNSTKRLHCHQELLVFFWKICDYNKKFLYFVLKSSDVLDVLVPILYHLNDSRADQSRVGLMHIGVFILLLLSGERNFGVRLNKPYTATIPMDIPVFTGTHADLLITVFHKIIATGHQRLQPLFDCLLTILVNVSPYLKTLSMVASVKLLHLLEAFSTPWFLFSAPSNHHLVFFLLEIFNNIIQYQFDGNSNLVYTIIRKRHVFHSLANIPTDMSGIAKCLSTRKGGRYKGSPVVVDSKNTNNVQNDTITSSTKVNKGGKAHNSSSNNDNDDIESYDGEDEDVDNKSEIIEESMEGSRPAMPAEPGTLKASLLDTPEISQMTERESAHPLSPTSPADILENLSLNEDQENTNTSKTISPSTSSSSGTKSPSSPSQLKRSIKTRGSIRVSSSSAENNSITQQPSMAAESNVKLSSTTQAIWQPTPEWVQSWRSKLPLQTIMRLLQVLVPQVEKICIDKGLTDESEILKFLQHGTLVGLLPVPHPILIRKYQANSGTTAWFRTYMWGVIYLRNVDPAIWYDTEVKLFEIQRV